MNKIIFQISMLGFFIATVIFGMRSVPLFEVIMNAFIVCISILVAAILILGLNKFVFNESQSETGSNDNGNPGSQSQKRTGTYKPGIREIKNEIKPDVKEEPHAA